MHGQQNIKIFLIKKNLTVSLFTLTWKIFIFPRDGGIGFKQFYVHGDESATLDIVFGHMYICTVLRELLLILSLRPINSRKIITNPSRGSNVFTSISNGSNRTVFEVPFTQDQSTFGFQNFAYMRCTMNNPQCQNITFKKISYQMLLTFRTSPIEYSSVLSFKLVCELLQGCPL
jgi:hypothetical protein